MSQHFLLTAAARSVSLKQILRMEEAEAWAMFCSIRWPETEGGAGLPALRMSDVLEVPAAQRSAAVPLLGLPARLQPDVGHPVRLPQAGDPRLPGGGRDLLRRGQGQGGARAVARSRRSVQDRLRAGPQDPRSDGLGG